MNNRTFFLAIATFVLAAVGLCSCELNYFPSDEVSPEQLSKSYEGLCIMTDGNYSMLKANMEYQGSSSTSYTFVRRGLEMLAFPADEMIISGKTSSTIFEAYTMERYSTLKNVQYVWWCLYKVIMGANSVLEAIPDNATAQELYLKGENYFLRAYCHLYLCNLYAHPYSFGRENPGVVLRLKSGATGEDKRATVGECFDQIEADLLQAIDLMSKGGTRRGNNGYANLDAAKGLLSRVYLYEEKNDKVIDLVEKDMLGGSIAAASSKIMSTAEFPTYFANTLTAKETLFCVAYTAQEVNSLGQSLYAGMLYTDPVTGIGWGEAYPCDPMIALFERYPEDLRYSEYIIPQIYDENQWMVRYAGAGEDYRDARPCINLKATKEGDEFTFTTAAGEKCITFTEIENTYPVRYAMINKVKTLVYVTKQMEYRESFPKYYVTKFSYQDGLAMGASPSYVRWAEVLLNLAEAYSKSGRDDDALALVNVIRQRAGIRNEGMFTKANMAQRGCPTSFDVVMNERHLELAFEGFRIMDLVRNKIDIDRRFPGLHTWEVVPYNADKILYPIPYDEVSVNGLPQNPGY